MKKNMFALVGMIITLLFILIALLGTWYTGTFEDGDGGIYFSLRAQTIEDEDGERETTSYSEMRDDLEENMGEDADTGRLDVYRNTFYIVIIAFIIALIAIVTLFGNIFNFGKPETMKMLGTIFVILTFIFALVAALYFMTALPSEMSKDMPDDVGFWDEVDLMIVKMSIGPGYAWYLMLVGGIIALVSAIFIFMDKKPPLGTPPVQ